MIKIILIRHSMTVGNLNKRYIGITDESLAKEGIDLIKNKKYPKAYEVYSSPLRRCIETAKIIYRGIEPIISNDLRECDFGEFENKNYEELKDNINYNIWLESNGQIAFPGGEGKEEFKNRCQEAFNEIVEKVLSSKKNEIVLVVHGGTIMAILDKYSYPHKDFYNWQIKNGEGYIAQIDEKEWKFGVRKIKIIKKI